ncbi:MAG: aminopeptidase P family protein [Deltaproteobacteria bacterium]|nr:aminopeptidase P family protein [Deltaproteobacteria bacterium]
MSNARLIFDSPERNADLYYATRFTAPDDILFLERQGKRYLILSDLEYERGRKEAKGVRIFSLAEWQEKAKRARQEPNSIGVIATLLTAFKIKKITVPRSTAFYLVDGLRKKSFKVESGTHPFCPERIFKTPQEKKWMVEAQRMTFRSFRVAEDILRQSKIRRGLLYWKGKVLTSERVRFEMEKFLLAQNFQPVFSAIVAGGRQACDPHCIGSGPLRPHQAIIIDCFPRSARTRFYGDATRTFCKGKAPPELKKQYAAVQFAQEMAIAKIKAGINGKTIHRAIQKHFERSGFPTKKIGGKKQGFIHGTGHGIGLEIHEEPTRISGVNFKLKKGHVVTVEPGLYYYKTGGVRLEDLVYVTGRGCEVLANYPKRLEIP